MEKNNIIEVHKKCLEFLLTYQSKHENFYFVPRIRNNNKRLEQGMFFRGNDSYMSLTFWDGNDNAEKIYNINFTVYGNLQSVIDLTCRDSELKVPYIKEIKDLLEENGRIFEETKINRWKYLYSKDIEYLDALMDFIENIKPIIDMYLSEHTESQIYLANADTNEYVKRLPVYETFHKVLAEEKKTGTVTICPSEYYITLKHNELSNKLEMFLKSNGYINVHSEKNHVDIQATDKNGNKIFFELKTLTTVRLAIRHALGQLLEYNYYPTKNKADILVVATNYEASDNDKKYLQHLRNQCNIPIWYCQFDEKTNILSERY